MDGRCLVVCTSLKTKVEEKWYFHNGSSRHMTGNREFLINLQPYSLESITLEIKVKAQFWVAAL